MEGFTKGDRNMVKVIAEFFIKEEAITTAIEKAEPAVKSTREEFGNITYEVFTDVKEPLHLVFVEEWKSQEALQEHMNTEHFKQFMEAITPLQTKEPVINLYSKVL